MYTVFQKLGIIMLCGVRGTYGDLNSGICLGYESLFKYNTYLFEIERELINPFIIHDNGKIYIPY